MVQINGDFSGLNPTGAPHVAPQSKRVADAPLRQGQKADDERRQQQAKQKTNDGRPVFRDAVTEATQAGINAAVAGSVQTPETGDNDTPEFVRPEKRSEDGPVSLSEEDSNGLLSNLAAARHTAENAASARPQQVYESAANQYAKQAVSSANVFAGRGDLLELQA